MSNYVGVMLKVTEMEALMQKYEQQNFVLSSQAKVL